MLKDSFNIYSEDTAILEQIPFSKSPFVNGLKVCVVDDNDDSLCMVTFIFEEYQAEIKTAKSVDEAIQIIEEWKPDVVISDIVMPDKDGYSLIRFIRHNEGFCGGFLPAIALTSYVTPESLKTAIDVGFQQVICKPFDIDELVATVVNIARTRS